jgi:amino acid adenylation domain-containing protein
MKTSFDTLKHYPLSSSQREIWFDQILHPDVPLYNIGGTMRIDGPIEPELFEKALNQVIEENDALRIMLVKEKTLAAQVFVENVHIKLDFHDFSNQENAEKQALEWMQREFVKPFQLYEGLLFRFALCKVSDNCYYWFKKYHHLIADGWNHCLIAQRVASAYNALLLGQTVGEQKRYSYRDFIQNDQTYFESKKFTEDKHYWFEKFQKLPEQMIPGRYAGQFQGKTIPSQRSVLHLERTFYNQLVAFAKENNSSTFQLILGVLYCYFTRTCVQKELILGLPLLNRSTPSFKQTVGLFTKVIPASFRFGSDLSFLELLKSIGIESRTGARHKRFPISELNRQLKTGREHRQQIFDLALIYLDNNYDDIQFADSPVEMRLLTHGIEQDALMIFVNDFDKQQEVKIDFDYSLGAFEPVEIELLKARFECLLHDVLCRPNVPIRELQIMPDEEYQKILFEFNETTTEYPRDKTIVVLFEEQVDKTPDAIAIVFENQQLTYQELNTRANQLAYHLQSLGVRPEVLVGICVERSLEMVIGILGILKAGGAYVPLDPRYPKERLAFIMEDTQTSIVVTQNSLVFYLLQQKTQLLCLDTEWELISPSDSKNLVSQVKQENLAYVIYTSGSTGKPKGVAIEHHSVVTLLMWAKEVFTSEEIAGVLASTSICFDLSIFELFVPLSWGGKIILVDNALHLSTLSADLGVTLINTVPSAMGDLVRTNSIPASVRVVNLAGEALQSKLVQQIYQQETIEKVFNLYGPSEDTTYSTWALIQKESKEAPSIGCPVANTQVYVLDENKQSVPIGVCGELYISGDGLARGYLNRPELTAEKFIPNPFSNDPKARLYKTGDLARYLPDGNIEYLGRIDNQVKIRGFRIELGEIETILNQESTVQEAVVIAREDEPGDKRLVAYIVSKLIPKRLPLKTNCLVELEHQSPITLTTEEISDEGVCLVGVPHTWEIGKQVSIRLQLSDVSDELCFEGHIAWHQGQQAGIQFTAMSPSTQVQFCQVMDNLFETQGILKSIQRTSGTLLREVLRQKLPDYMIPSRCIFLKKIPLTPNGKVDRKALPQPDGQRVDLEMAYLAPKTEIEHEIANILQTVLHVNQIGIYDNFFDLGGNSLLLVQVQEKLVEVLNQEIPVLTFFQYPSITALAHYLEDKSPSEQIALKKSYDRAHKEKTAIQKFRKHHKAR